MIKNIIALFNWREEMKTHLQVVGAMLVNEEGRILSTLRPLGKKLGNHWEFPGGKVEGGETKEEAIIREIWEELDCHIEVEEEVGENTLDYGDVIITLTVFRCRMKNEIKIKEHAAFVWIKPENLLSLVWAPVDIPILEKIIYFTREKDYEYTKNTTGIIS